MSLGRLSTRHFWNEGGNRKWAVSYLTLTTTTTMLSIFSLSKNEKLWKSGRDHCPGMQNVHFRFPSIAQKRRVF